MGDQSLLRLLCSVKDNLKCNIVAAAILEHAVFACREYTHDDATLGLPGLPLQLSSPIIPNIVGFLMNKSFFDAFVEEVGKILKL